MPTSLVFFSKKWQNQLKLKQKILISCTRLDELQINFWKIVNYDNLKSKIILPCPLYRKNKFGETVMVGEESTCLPI